MEEMFLCGGGKVGKKVSRAIRPPRKLRSWNPIILFRSINIAIKPVTSAADCEVPSSVLRFFGRPKNTGHVDVMFRPGATKSRCDLVRPAPRSGTVPGCNVVGSTPTGPGLPKLLKAA